MTTPDSRALPDAEVDGIRCMLMRGGTSKGAYFLADDVPAGPNERDDLMLRIMGSPDKTQIDGLGGAHPLTSKVAIVAPSTHPDIDVDYLFLQVAVDAPQVSAAQTCGNLLAGVGPFAIERGLVDASADTTTVRIRLVNTGDIATATFATPGGRVDYRGTARIDGVPGTAAAIDLSVTGGDKALFPSGALTDTVAGVDATLIDNGMPVVLVRASECGATGSEEPADLEQNSDLRARVEAVRLAAGHLMGLGDVSAQSVPKVVLLSAPRAGGAISTRTFIPHRVHTSIGVLMAASVAAGIRIPGTVGHDLATQPPGDATDIEHPSGTFTATVGVWREDECWHASSSSLRTARKIFDGTVFARPRS